MWDSPSASTRVHDRSDVLRLGMVGRMRVVLTEHQELVQSKHPDLVRCTLDSLECSLGHLCVGSVVDDDFERWSALDDGGDSTEEIGVGEDAVDLRLVDRVLQLR